MDTNPLAGVEEALDALRSAGGGRSVEALSPAELIAVSAAYGALRRQIDAAQAPVAAEVARQSRRELGSDSLAKKQGYSTPASLIATTGGGSIGESLKLIRVGEATKPKQALSGEELPAKHPYVADALASGRIGVTVADDISKMLDAVELRASRQMIDEAEKQLVELAPGLTPDQVRKLIVRAEAHLDPDGLEPAEDRLRDDRFLIVREERDGSISLKGSLDPVSGAPVKALIDGMVTNTMRTRGRAASTQEQETGHVCQGNGSREGSVPGDAPQSTTTCDCAALGDGADIAPLVDARTRKQMQADAFVDICRHALGCEQVATGPTTTVIVRMTLSELENRTGRATIDGLDRPVSAAAARRIAIDAQVIPAVLGSQSEVLDWGRAKRLFTPAQKLAIAERDGGCAFCGAAPSMCSVHHIEWWGRDRGRTDLSDGVLLCTGCHHRVHDDGWSIDVRGSGTGGEVWFVPPPWLDRAQTPRRGMSAHFGLAA
ncbi:HNH endonuclease [Microbacterium halotolerans]|uniref:HNH endonuclease n=1 Tax=Microbacterium halotolerans TaxID=246613 RepID=UPI000E6AA208|nr:HNH endonuclease signature motif containing protein [Microbacterium halotolerans]